MPAGRDCSFGSWGALKRTRALKGTGLPGAEHDGAKSRRLGTDKDSFNSEDKRAPSPTQTRGLSPGTEDSAASVGS